jgi:UDP-glucose 4-epimerase
MNILVTGGAGFIGRHLVKSLLKSGYKVTIFDNFSNSSEKQIVGLVDDGLNVIRGDITNYESLLNSLSGNDLVIHLAAQISVQKSIDDPEFTHKVNVEGTVNLLNACVKQNIKKIIAVSSAAVYGVPDDLPLSEKSQTKPISPYGESKLAMENSFKEFSQSSDLNCIILRLFNVFGEGQSQEYAGVITKFMEKIQSDKPLIIFGDGNNTRDFISIDYVVNFFHLAIEKLDEKKASIYNIATGKQVSINELANLMISISGKKLEIEHSKPLEGDIKHSQASISRAQSELGFFPKVSLGDGIEHLLKSTGII